MTLHEGIRDAIQRFVNDRHDCAIISPTAVAAAIFAEFAERAVEPHIAYASIEHFKQMARQVLAARFEDDGEDNPAYADQGELFAGHLQERYPVPRKRGDEPQYKLREALTDEEVAWNVRVLRRSADARLAHADALRAWALTRTVAA